MIFENFRLILLFFFEKSWVSVYFFCQFSLSIHIISWVYKLKLLITYQLNLKLKKNIYWVIVWFIILQEYFILCFILKEIKLIKTFLSKQTSIIYNYFELFFSYDYELNIMNWQKKYTENSDWLVFGKKVVKPHTKK